MLSFTSLFVLMRFQSLVVWHCGRLAWGGEVGLVYNACSAFVDFARVGFCPFALLGVGDFLRLVIVALPGLFYLFEKWTAIIFIP